MAQDWWELPGPSSLLDQVEQDLRSGKNIIILLPEHSPRGIERAILRRIERDGGWPWHDLECKFDQDRRPIEQIILRFIVNPDSEATWNSNYLAECAEFQSQIICVAGFCDGSWAEWSSFLQEYAHACRTLPAHLRTLFVAIVEGQPTAEVPREDACLSVYSWDGWVDQTDMLLYTAQRFSRDHLTRVQYRVIIAIITQLALWDPNTADLLVQQDLAAILNPRERLQHLAVQRGWHQVAPNEQSWHRGMVAKLEGETRKHSALLALSDPGNELDSRIWSAQVGVLLPYIEERRRSVLKRLNGKLRVPWQSQFALITDVLDLEIGHIEAQIYDYRIPISDNDFEVIKRCKMIRNKLSHLEVVGEEFVSRLE